MSYASEDREAARSLRDVLVDHGLDAWVDESALGGGEEWDRKIRREIRDCDYFMPVVSARTEARHEGYFRREWRLAVERTLDMADDHAFLLPVVIDDTPQASARVPEKFLTVQWLKVPDGKPTSAFESMLDRIVQGTLGAAPPPRQKQERAGAFAGSQGGTSSAASGPLPFPPFPEEIPGRLFLYWGTVLVWCVRCSWVGYKRVPRWIRIVIVVWAAIALISHCSSSDDRDDRRRTAVTPARMAKLKAISKTYESSAQNSDVATLAASIAKEFADTVEAGSRPALLAIAFTAPGGNPDAEKLANSAFAMTYGMLSLSHKGQVGLTKEPGVSSATAIERGRASHSTYVLFGVVEEAGGRRKLTTTIAAVADASIVWSKSYEAQGADAAKIAADVASNLPSLDEK